MTSFTKLRHSHVSYMFSLSAFQNYRNNTSSEGSIEKLKKNEAITLTPQTSSRKVETCENIFFQFT